MRWHALSSDGHVVSGVYTFGVRMPAPPPTEAVGAQGPTRTEHVVRWAYFLALALLVGVLGFRLLVLRGPLPKRLEKRFYALELLGAVAVLEVGIAAFILRAEDALQLPFSRLLYGDLSPIASGTRFGRAFIAMTLGFSIVTALLFLALADGPRRAALGGVPARARARVRPLALRALRGRLRRRRSGRSSRTGCTCPRRCSGSAGSSRWRPRSGRRRRSCGGGRSSASRGWRRC